MPQSFGGSNFGENRCTKTMNSSVSSLFCVSFFSNSPIFRALYVQNCHDELTKTDESHRFFRPTNLDELFSSVSSKIVPGNDSTEAGAIT